MTTEIPNPADEIATPATAPAITPADATTSLALDDFSNAPGDGAVGDGQIGNVGTDADQTSSREALSSTGAAGLEALYDIPVNITVVLGRTQIEVTDLLALNKGDVVALDRKVGEAIDIYVNKRLVARGEVVLVEERLGITMTEIIKGGSAT